jgi:hypothetical protein
LAPVVFCLGAVGALAIHFFFHAATGGVCVFNGDIRRGRGLGVLTGVLLQPLFVRLFLTKQFLEPSHRKNPAILRCNCAGLSILHV